MYGYIYETTNLVNGKKYIGQHKSSKLNKQYLGSGVIIAKAVEKYGKENFDVRIIEECYSKEELNEQEIYWIKFYNAVKDKNYYNVARGGYFWGKPRKLGYKVSQETKDKISKANSGRIFTEEHRRKISESRKGKGLGIILPEDVRKRVGELNRQHLLGRTLSEEHKNKISIGEKNRYKNSPSPLLGRTLSEEHKNKIGNNTSKSNTGRVWITNEKENKFMKKEDALNFLSNNKDWRFGAVRPRKR
ncbi:MAG: GIY-YIG nuclease family protein [Bacilli bacterium]|nr:GIY-YIG nuclease family protein [Bacilli bacterium]MBQ3307557.1 GIY-YIG nuclease family protein [Bacilli bacterium]